MTSALILLPQHDFDPTEVAVPWRAWSRAGVAITFATQTAEAAQCDPVTLTGEGLAAFARSLQARPANVALYHEMANSAEFVAPKAWYAVSAHDFDIVHFPGGHAAGMRLYLESAEIQRVAREAFAGKGIVSAICHGVIPLARSGVLKGRRTTGLTGMMESIAVAMTRHRLGEHYRTYPQSVEVETKAALSRPSDFDRGPLFPRFATEANPHAGFVVVDGNYISARWPGDAWTLTVRVLDVLEQVQ